MTMILDDVLVKFCETHGMRAFMVNGRWQGDGRDVCEAAYVEHFMPRQCGKPMNEATTSLMIQAIPKVVEDPIGRGVREPSAVEYGTVEALEAAYGEHDAAAIVKAIKRTHAGEVPPDVIDEAGKAWATLDESARAVFRDPVA